MAGGRAILVIILGIVLVGCTAGAEPSQSERASPTPSQVEPSPAAVTPSPTPVLTPTPASEATPEPVPAPDPTPQAEPPDIRPGSFADTVVKSVRVRSYPSVDDYSTKYSPLLPNHEALYVIAGPTSASGYWWYQVQLLGRVLSGGVVRGWVAAGDHDGTPWIAYADVDGPDLPPDFTPAELELLSGVRPDISGCVPLRKGLPPSATAALVCRPDESGVRRVVIVGFADEGDVVTEYLARVSAEGIQLRTHSGRCEEAPAEGAYVPGDTGDALQGFRSACFADGNGHAHYLATETTRVSIEVTGQDADVIAIQDWAWRGNQDAPGNPTVWRDLDG